MENHHRDGDERDRSQKGLLPRQWVGECVGRAPLIDAAPKLIELTVCPRPDGRSPLRYDPPDSLTASQRPDSLT
jgi:hypothetical protein